MEMVESEKPVGGGQEAKNSMFGDDWNNYFKEQ